MSNAIKHALVTGAGRGIGREVALGLAKHGYALALVARSKEQLDAVADEARAAGAPKAEVFVADLSNNEATLDAARHADKALGGIDTLVNAAGISSSAPVHKESVETLERMLTINLTAPFILIRELAAQMRERGYGRIVSIASVAGLEGFPYVSAYCASKHGLIGLTKAAAIELGPKGVTVNAVCPNYVDTEMTRQTIANIAKTTGRSETEARAEIEKLNPQGRLLTPLEVAESALSFIYGEHASANGQTLAI